MKKYLVHLSHYTNLLGVAFLALFGLITFSYDPVFQKAIIYSFAASYIVWGLIHHYLHDDLQLKVLLEYLLVAVLGVVLLLGIIN